MPTVDQLGTSIAYASGLNTTTSSAEWSIIISALNRAVRRIIAETDCLKGTPGSLAGDATTLDIALTTLTGLQSIDNVYVLSNGVYSPLPQVPVQSVIDARTNNRATMYAYEGGNLMVDGPVGVGNSLYIRWTPTHTALATGGAEATVTATGIPVTFHEDLLIEWALTFILEGFEGNEERAAYHRKLALEGLDRFRKFLTTRGGDDLPNSRYGAPHFQTSDPLTVR